MHESVRRNAQEGALRGYNPTKPGRPSHHPLKAGLGCGYVVNLWNRSGNVHTKWIEQTFLPRFLRGRT